MHQHCKQRNADFGADSFWCHITIGVWSTLFIVPPPQNQAKGEEPDEPDQVVVQMDRSTSTALYPSLE
jgi:hypothetical protein